MSGIGILCALAHCRAFLFNILLEISPFGIFTRTNPSEKHARSLFVYFFKKPINHIRDFSFWVSNWALVTNKLVKMICSRNLDHIFNHIKNELHCSLTNNNQQTITPYLQSFKIIICDELVLSLPWNCSLPCKSLSSTTTDQFTDFMRPQK